MNKKHPFDTDKRLSMFYTLAYKEYTSINNINKLMSKTGRYQGDILQQYPTFFSKKKRTDKRMGELIRSKPKPLFDYISQKVNVSNDSKALSNLLNSPEFRSLIRYPYPKSHNEITDFIAITAIIISSIKKLNQGKFNTNPIQFKVLLKKLLETNPNYSELHEKYPLNDEWADNVIKISDTISKFNQSTTNSLISLAPHFMLISDVIIGTISGIRALQDTL